MPASKELALRTTGVTYPGDPEQIRAVRADLRSLLGGCPRADDALLCVSELATNAVLHTHSGLAERTFTVRSQCFPGEFIWIEVEDEGGPWVPTVVDSERGRGLEIVRALADDWGIDGDNGGRTIWAHFNWDTP